MPNNQRFISLVYMDGHSYIIMFDRASRRRAEKVCQRWLDNDELNYNDTCYCEAMDSIARLCQRPTH